MAPIKYRLSLQRMALPTLAIALPLVLFGRAAYRTYLRNSLFDAVDRGDTRAAIAALDRGADPNAIDRSVNSGFHGFPVLCRAVSQERTEIVATLLDRGANANMGDSGLATPLSLAIGRRNADVVSLLLLHGADPNHKSLLGTPIRLASTSNGPIGTPVNLPVYRLLRDHGAHVTMAEAILNDDADTVAFILDHGEDPNGSGVDNPPLSMAAFRGNATILRLLIRRGADVNRVTPNGWTALRTAVSAMHAETVRMLLTGGANPNAISQGESVLHMARQRRLLIDDQQRIGALVLGRSAGEAQRENERIIRLLESRGARDLFISRPIPETRTLPGQS